VDLDNLSKKAEMDASRVPVKDLVQSAIVDGNVFPSVTFFELSPKAKVMIASVSKLNNSVLLRKFWKENGDKAQKRTAEREGHKMLLSVDDVEELVWTPSNEQLQFLQERFLSGAITFAEIDKLFKVFDKNEELAKEIKLITSKNDSQAKALDSLIKQRIEQIDQYHKLHNCIDAAESILEFKTALGLTGNFQLVVDLHNQVCWFIYLFALKF